jgi:hypothetical protein
MRASERIWFSFRILKSEVSRKVEEATMSDSRTTLSAHRSNYANSDFHLPSEELVLRLENVIAGVHDRAWL